jgi:hypothetical protein
MGDPPLFPGKGGLRFANPPLAFAMSDAVNASVDA